MDVLNEPLSPNPFDLPPLPIQAVPKKFWLGTLPGCPQYNVGIGGVMFHRYVDPPVGVDVDSGSTQRAYGRGKIEDLTEDQKEAILVRMKSLVVRFYGNRGQGAVHDMASKYFDRIAEDQPLAKFVYLVPMDEGALIKRMSPSGEYPLSVYEMANGGQGRRELPPRPTKPVPDIAPEIEDLEKRPEFQHVPPQLKGKGK